jgi:transcriptional pleiotropic regulator of transition state genes
MRATGYVRPMDKLGRVVLPKAVRDERGIVNRAPYEIWLQGEFTVVRRWEPSCVFCGDHEDLIEFRGRLVCRECRRDARTTDMGKAVGRESG